MADNGDIQEIHVNVAVMENEDTRLTIQENNAWEPLPRYRYCPIPVIEGTQSPGNASNYSFSPASVIIDEPEDVGLLDLSAQTCSNEQPNCTIRIYNESSSESGLKSPEDAQDDSSQSPKPLTISMSPIGSTSEASTPPHDNSITVVTSGLPALKPAPLLQPFEANAKRASGSSFRIQKRNNNITLPDTTSYVKDGDNDNAKTQRTYAEIARRGQNTKILKKTEKLSTVNKVQYDAQYERNIHSQQSTSLTTSMEKPAPLFSAPPILQPASNEYQCIETTAQSTSYFTGGIPTTTSSNNMQFQQGTMWQQPTYTQQYAMPTTSQSSSMALQPRFMSSHLQLASAAATQQYYQMQPNLPPLLHINPSQQSHTCVGSIRNAPEIGTGQSSIMPNSQITRVQDIMPYRSLLQQLFIQTPPVISYQQYSPNLTIVIVEIYSQRMVLNIMPDHTTLSVIPIPR